MAKNDDMETWKKLSVICESLVNGGGSEAIGLSSSSTEHSFLISAEDGVVPHECEGDQSMIFASGHN